MQVTLLGVQTTILEDDDMALLARTGALPRTQSPFGLLSVATDRSATVDRWTDGLTWLTLGIDGIVGAPADPCADLPDVVTDDFWSSATGFYVRAQFDCGIGEEDKEAQAALRMASLSRIVVEDQVWTGTQGASPTLVDPGTVVLTTAAQPIAYGVGLVDDFIARTYGALGVVHMLRSTADVAFAAGVLEIRSGRLVTALGTPVAVYSVAGAGPTGTLPADGDAWVYGTPAVSYWYTDFPPENRVDTGTNTWTSAQTQKWAVGWDATGTGAALVTLT